MQALAQQLLSQTPELMDKANAGPTTFALNEKNETFRVQMGNLELIVGR